MRCKKLVLICLSCSLAYAAEHEVKMFSFEDGEPMIFKPAVLTIATGDTVTFIPTQKGHQVSSVSIPKGAKAFESKLNEKFSVTLDKTGIYFYTCIPHRTMNMGGLIQVGKSQENRDSVEKAIKSSESKAIMNQGRITKYLRQLDEMNTSVDTLPKKSY